MRIVIAGATEEGIHLAGSLSERKHEVVLIDRDRAALARAEEELDVMVLVGDPTHRSVLVEAMARDAHGFVALTNSDPENMLGAALARSLGARVAVARMDTPGFYQTTEAIETDVLGVDVTLCATRLATTGLVSLLMDAHSPYVRNFALDSVRVALLPIEGSPYLDKPLDALPATGQGRIVAVVRDGFVRPPTYVARLDAVDQLLVAGPRSDVLDLWTKVHRQHSHQRAVVVGGGDVGMQLASALGPHLERVEIIEKDRHQAEQVAGTQPSARVVAGDARSAAFLQDQQIGSVEYLLAVTGDDEVNLLVSLLGRKMGAGHTFTLLHRPGYAELYAELGVEGTIGTYDLVTRTISDALVPRGRVRVELLPGTGFSVVEWRLSSKPVKLADGQTVALGDLALPQGVMLLAVARGPRALAAAKGLELRGDENLVLACPTRQVQELEHALAKLEGRR